MHSYPHGKAKRKELTKKTEEVKAQMGASLEACGSPDDQNDNKDENKEGCEGNEAAPRPLLFGLAHVGNELCTLLSCFRGFPVGRRTKGNTENDRSEDPKNWEYCRRARKS